ncbi:MAG: helix-hairpin-helix domain-containing protein [Bacteroidetes bacterium]|nr:helix-hairpin-helix domain-containing protein [Bacteroidota bacterium]
MVGSFLNNYFGFNKQQRNGLLVLALISFTLFLVRIIYPYFISPGNIVIQNLPLIERKLDSSFEHSAKNYSGKYNNNKNIVNRFVFDPNTVSFDQLLQLGFKEKLAKTFLKFREKGFVFKQKKDLQKVFGISDNFYAQLEPYVLIENKSAGEQKNTNNISSVSTPVKSKTKIMIELNSADSLMLLEINGVGPTFAKRILKYKSILGGYTNIEQLKEVYGFTDELYEKIRPFVSIDAANIKKIDLNKDDFKTINKHPYLSYELTKTICNWRKKTPITSANIKEIINDEPVYNKLMPYLVF